MAVLSYCKRMLTIGLLTLAGCAYEKTISYKLEPPDSSVVLESTGYAVISVQVGDSYEEKLLSAMAASRMDAYRKLAEQLYGARLNVKTDMTFSVVDTDSVSKRVQGIVKGAELIDERVDGAFYVSKFKLDTARLLPLVQPAIRETESKIKWWY